MAMATMATMATTMTTAKHSLREKHICSKCGSSVYHLRRHVQNNCIGVRNANVPMTFIKNPKTG
eukprot:10001797-Ditylum_brightwellii.AAC.1